MQEQAAFFTARMGGENLAAQLTEPGQPGAEIARQLLIDFAPQALRDSRAFAGGGDGDLQVAAADDRSKKEIAVGYVVDAVAQDAPRDGGAIDLRVDFRRAGGGDDNEVAVDVRGGERTGNPFEPALLGERADFVEGLG